MYNNENFFKKLILLMKEPNLIFLCVNWTITLAGIIGSLIMLILKYTGFFSYIVYAIAALSLAYSVYTVVKYTSTIRERVITSLKRQKFIKDYLENYSFKTVVGATISLLINLGFVAFNTVYAILNNSVWFGVSAVYYLLLCVLKGSLFFADNKLQRQANNDELAILSGQLKNYRICGIAILVLELAMTGVVTLMVLQQKPTEYSEIVAITLAAYTFYKITFSIINVVKARTHNNPKVQSFRNIRLAETAVSLVSLQMALVSTFSDATTNLTILNAIVGFVACAFTVGLGVYMIVKATYKIKKINNNNKEIDNECY